LCDLAGCGAVHLGLYLGQADGLVMDGLGLPEVSRIGGVHGHVLDVDAMVPEGDRVPGLVITMGHDVNTWTLVTIAPDTG
jgi:hypothetical protein